MRKTVTFIRHQLDWDPLNDSLVGQFKFSVIDSSLIGTPRERGTIHTVKVIITDTLMDYWGLRDAIDSVVSNDMAKVAFQSAEDYITDQLRKGPLPEGQLPMLLLSTKNSSTSCPYSLSNIAYPIKTAFAVDISDQVSQPLGKCLEDFAAYIRSEMRMTFWRSDKAQKRYKWVSQPEQRGKDLLRAFLNGRFGDSFNTFEEIRSGAGFIDIFVMSPSREKAVIELKMCGHGYAQTWAQNGIQQLTHYMENKNTKIGYLIIFDSRSKDFSQGFQIPDMVNGTPITTLIADLRPYVKSGDAPSDA